jgi:hypothetical protein
VTGGKWRAPWARRTWVDRELVGLVDRELVERVEGELVERVEGELVERVEGELVGLVWVVPARERGRVAW